MFKICDYTKPELDVFRELCNFTEDESAVFEHLVKDRSIVFIAMELNICESKVSKIKKRIRTKIKRITDNN